MAHRGDCHNAVAGVGHVESSDQDIEALGGDQLQSFDYIGGGDNGADSVCFNADHKHLG